MLPTRQAPPLLGSCSTASAATCDNGGEISVRKAYLGSIIDRIEVDDRQIRIVGRKDVLEQAIAADGRPVPGVRSFVRKWRTGQDSEDPEESAT
jgi:site-specific DNA recombinase